MRSGKRLETGRRLSLGAGLLYELSGLVAMTAGAASKGVFSAYDFWYSSCCFFFCLAYRRRTPMATATTRTINAIASPAFPPVESPDCAPSEAWEAVADAGATAASECVWENEVVNRVVAVTTDVSEFEARFWEAVVACVEVAEVLLIPLKSNPAVGEVLVLVLVVEMVCGSDAGGPRMMPVLAAAVGVGVGVTVTNTTDTT